MTPNEIGNKRFNMPKRGYYAADDVDSFLGSAATYAAQLSRENADLRRRLETAQKKLDEYDKDQQALSQALLNAQRLADSVVRDSQRKAEITIRDAEIKAQQIREKVKDAIVGEQQDFIALRQRVADFRRQILELYKRQVETVMETPDETALGLKKPDEKPQGAPAEVGDGKTERADSAAEAKPGPDKAEPSAPSAGGPNPPAEPGEAGPGRPEDSRPQADRQPKAAPSDGQPSDGRPTQPAAPAARPSRSATIPSPASAPAIEAVDPEGEAAADKEPAARSAQRAEPPRLNLVYDERSGQYVPAGAPRPERFDDLRFGSDYHIGQDDKGTGGLFRKRK